MGRAPFDSPPGERARFSFRSTRTRLDPCVPAPVPYRFSVNTCGADLTMSVYDIYAVLYSPPPAGDYNFPPTDVAAPPPDE